MAGMIKKSNRLIGFMTVIVFHVGIYGQTTGSIVGTVVDPHGAFVPNAVVTVSGQGGQRFSASSGESGLYNIPVVPSGSYTVTISAVGFKRSITTNVNV